MMRRELIHRLVDELFDLHDNHPELKDAKNHFRSARREVLLGVRSLIDAALERSQDSGEEAAQQHGVKTIPVEDQ